MKIPAPIRFYFFSLLVLSGMSLVGWIAVSQSSMKAVASFFTLFQGHGALDPNDELKKEALSTVLLWFAKVTFLIAWIVVWWTSKKQNEANTPSTKTFSLRPQSIAAPLIKFAILFQLAAFFIFAAAYFLAFQNHYSDRFAGKSFDEKFTITIGDYPERWGRLNKLIPPGARILRHTRSDVTFLPAFIYPRLTLIYEGVESSPVHPVDIREDWLREKKIDWVMVTWPWEPGAPILTMPVEEFLRVRRNWTNSNHSVD